MQNVFRINKELQAEVATPTVEVHHRTDAEYEVISKALMHGNRDERRRPLKFGSGDRMLLTQAERNRRNAARRVAKKSRKSNKKK